MIAWLHTPAVLASLVTLLAAALPVYFYVRLKAEMRKLLTQLATQNDVTKAAGALAERMTGLELRLDVSEQNKAEHDEWISEAESLHLNRRGQVLRLYKRGDSVPEIASALRVGQGEVKLIVKVYELSRSSSGNNDSF